MTFFILKTKECNYSEKNFGDIFQEIKRTYTKEQNISQILIKCVILNLHILVFYIKIDK